MKKTLLSLILLSSISYASCIKESNTDQAMNSIVAVDSDGEKCFNMYDDSDDNSKQSITTKIMKKDFTLKVTETTSCQMTYDISDENFTLINNKTNTLITDKDGNAIEGNYDKDNKTVTFNVPGIYKDVTVLMTYKEKKKISWTSSTTDANDTSTDNFAIRPYEYNITLRSKSLKIGQSTPIYMNVIDDANDTVTNYSISSINLEANVTPNDVPVQYSFDIKNGKSLPSGIIQFLKDANNISVVFRDTIFASIDDDDTQDTCKDINGTVDGIDVTKNYKSWAGSSTENSSNNPETKTITSKIKQNQNKDLHFQKMGW